MSKETQTSNEFGSNPRDIQQFNLAVREYLSHNNKYWFGAVLGRVFDERAEKQRELEGLIVDEGYTPEEARRRIENPNVSPEDEAEMAQGVLEAISSDVFNRIGLKLVGRDGRDVIRLPQDEFQPIELHFGAKPKSEEDHVVKEVGISINNGHNFVSFLHRIKPEEVNWLLAHNLNKVCWSILWGLSDSVRKGKEAPDVHEALAYATSIADAIDQLRMADKAFGLLWNKPDYHYEKYPLEDPAPRFRAYDYWNKQEVLREYVIGEKAGFFEKGEYKFLGLTDTPERAEQRSDVYLEILRHTKANPGGQELFELMVKSINQKLESIDRFWQWKMERPRQGIGYKPEETLRDIENFVQPFLPLYSRLRKEMKAIAKDE